MKYLICFMILGAFSSLTFAKNLELQKGSRTIFISSKTNWDLRKDLFGMPFIYFSPIANGQRSNISFTDTGAEVELDINSLASSQKTYQKDKEDWGNSVGATPIGYEPYEVKINKLGHKVHRIGFSYAFEGKTYLERSHYIECRGRIIFSKSLRLKENEAHDKDFSDLIQNLDCGGV